MEQSGCRAERAGSGDWTEGGEARSAISAKPSPLPQGALELAWCSGLVPSWQGAESLYPHICSSLDIADPREGGASWGETGLCCQLSATNTQTTGDMNVSVLEGLPGARHYVLCAYTTPHASTNRSPMSAVSKPHDSSTRSAHHPHSRAWGSCWRPTPSPPSPSPPPHRPPLLKPNSDHICSEPPITPQVKCGFPAGALYRAVLTFLAICHLLHILYSGSVTPGDSFCSSLLLAVFPLPEKSFLLPVSLHSHPRLPTFHLGNICRVPITGQTRRRREREPEERRSDSLALPSAGKRRK